MKKKFLKNLFLLIILNLLVKPFWIFAIDRTVQNRVGTEEYGFYFSLLSFSFLFNILLDLGITNFNNRSVAQNPLFIKDNLSNIIALKLMLAVLYTIVSLSVALALGYDNAQLLLLLVILFNQFLSSFLLYLRSNISGLQYYTTDSLLSVLDRVMMIVLCSLLLWGNMFHAAFRISWFVYAQTLSYIIGIVVCSVILVGKTDRLSFAFNWQSITDILKQIAPYALLGLLMSFYTRVDSVLIERMLPDGKAQAGMYAQSFRILDAFANFSLLFASLLLPMFSRMLATKEDFRPLLKTSFALLFILCLGITIPCAAFSEEIMKTLYHDGGEYSAKVFSVLILSFIPISLNYIIGTLLTANGNLKALNYASGIGVAVNIILNLVLISNYNILGAAVASLVTQTLMIVIALLICLRLWKFSISKTDLLRYSSFVVLSVAIVYASHSLTGPWTVRFLGAITSIGILGLAMGICSFRPFFVLLRSKLER